MRILPCAETYKLALGITFALAAFIACARVGAAAETCEALRPNPPRNLSEEVVGKIDTKLSGLTGRLLNAGGTIDGTYKEASTDILKDYPNADKLYLWDRTIYLYCIVIMQSGLPDREKLDRVEKLMDRMGHPPNASLENKIDKNTALLQQIRSMLEANNYDEIQGFVTHQSLEKKYPLAYALFYTDGRKLLYYGGSHSDVNFDPSKLVVNDSSAGFCISGLSVSTQGSGIDGPGRICLSQPVADMTFRFARIENIEVVFEAIAVSTTEKAWVIGLTRA